jgi:hypothetical protein
MGGPERPVSGLSIKDGAEVECGGRRFIIMQLIGFDFVVARDIETDELVRLAVVDLNPVSPAPSTEPPLPDLSKVDDRDWAEARQRLDLIAPLLDGSRSRGEDTKRNFKHVKRRQLDRVHGSRAAGTDVDRSAGDVSQW